MAGALLDDWPQISATRLHAFNRLDDGAAQELLRSCLDVDRWVDTMLAGRPYGSVDDLLDTARLAAKPLTDAEVERVCPHRSDRGAEPAAVVDALIGGSRSAVCLPWGARAHLAECLTAYQERFGRPFVIRHAGRSGREIAAKLEARLANDAGTETRLIAAELRQIALLRLVRLIPV